MASYSGECPEAETEVLDSMYARRRLGKYVAVVEYRLAVLCI